MTDSDRRSMPSSGVGARAPSRSSLDDPPEVEKARGNPKSVLGKYVLTDELGRGGMGVVFRAWQTDLRRWVALKVLNLTQDASITERFRREAILASQVRHPGIVAVHEYGEADGRHYIVMDLLAGEPLDKLLKKRRPSVRQAVEIIAEAADALAAAHKQNIIHRDIKPSNLIVEAREGAWHVFLTDFGLAKTVDMRDKVTQAGTILGTPHYMSPEQARGDQRMTPASDVYSLGALLFEMVTGRQVFITQSSKVYELLQKIISEEPPRLRAVDPKLPQDLETVILKCLEKVPSARYRDAGALAADLRLFLEHRAVSAVPAGRSTRIMRWVRRRPWVMASVAAGLAAALGLTLVVAIRAGRSTEVKLTDQIRDLELKLSRAHTPEEQEALKREIEKLKREPSPRQPVVPERPVSDDSSRRAFDALCTAIQANPRNYTRHLHALEEFLRTHESAPEGSAARTLRSALEAVQKEELAVAIEVTEMTMMPLCRERKFSMAHDVVDKLASRYELKADHVSLVALRRKLEAMGEAAWREVLARADQLAGLGKFEEAREVLREVRAWGIAPYPALAEERMTTLSGRLPGTSTPVVESSDRVFEELIRETASALVGGDSKRAEELIAGARRGAQGDLLTELDRLEAVVRGLNQLPDKALLGLAQSAGKTLSLRLANGQTVRGELLAVRGESLVVRTEGAEMSYSAKDLAPPELVNAAREGGLSEESLTLARLLAGEKVDAPVGYAALFLAVHGLRLERGAQAVLEALRKTRDTAKAKELFAQVDGEYADTEVVAGARAEIEQIRQGLELKGMDVLSQVHANVKKMVGPVMQLEYAFQSDAELQDILAERWIPGAKQFAGYDVRRTDDGLVLQNARVTIGPAWAAGVEVEVHAMVSDDFQLIVAPLTLTYSATGKWKIQDARGSREILSGQAEPVSGEARIRLTWKAGALEVRCGTAAPEQASLEIEEAPQVCVAVGHEGMRLRRLHVSGVADAEWARREIADRVPTKGGSPQALITAKLTGWKPSDATRWRMENGVLRGESAGSAHAWIVTEKKVRNGRITMEYRVETGRSFSLTARGGCDAQVEMPLGVGESARWHRAELIVFEDRAWGAIDGVPQKVSPATGTVIPGGLTLTAGDGVFYVRDMRWQQMEQPPPFRAWTELINVAMNGWRVRGEVKTEKGILVVDGPFFARTILPWSDAEFALKCRLEVGAEAIVGFRISNANVGQEFLIAADGKWHELAVSYRGAETHVVLDGRTASLRSRTAAGQEGNLVLDVCKGRLEVASFRVRQ